MHLFQWEKREADRQCAMAQNASCAPGSSLDRTTVYQMLKMLSRLTPPRKGRGRSFEQSTVDSIPLPCLSIWTFWRHSHTAGPAKGTARQPHVSVNFILCWCDSIFPMTTADYSKTWLTNISALQTTTKELYNSKQCSPSGRSSRRS